MKDNIKQILLLGCDVSRSLTETDTKLSNDDKYKRSDSMIVVLLNKETNNVALISLMRDIWVHIDGYGDDRINTIISKGGPKLVIDTLNKYLDLNIDDYIILNMENLIKIIDELGGIDLDLSWNETFYINEMIDDVKEITGYKDKITYLHSEGFNHLNGIQTLTHVCDRYFGFCWKRGERQREVLRAMLTKAKQNKNKMFKLGLKMLKYVKTSLSPIDIISLAKVATKVDASKIITHCVPSEGTYTMVDDGTWHFEIDFYENSVQLQEIIENL